MYTKTKRFAYTVAIAMLTATALYFAAPFLIPIVLAGLFAMLLTRISGWLENKGVGRAIASICAVLMLVMSIVLLGFILSLQLGQLTQSIDEMRDRLTSGAKEFRDWISNTVGISVDEQNKMIEEQKNHASGQANSLLMRFLNSFAGAVINTVLVIVYIFLFLYYRDHLKQFILRIIPRENKQRVKEIIQKSVAVSGNYLTGLFSMIVM